MKQEYPTYTASSVNHEHLICWRSAVAGLFIAGLTFAAITALSLALGGSGLSDGTSGTNAGIFTGVSFFVAVVLSVLAGSYYAVRVRGHHGHRSHDHRSAYAQGLLVGSLVILGVLFQAVSAIGTAGKAAGNAIGATVVAAGAGAAAAGQSNMFQNIVEDNLGELNLKSSPEVVLRGVTARLMDGNETGAKNYLARQAGLTPTEADRRIAAAKAKVEAAVVDAREATATAMKATGWSVFSVIVFGVLSSLLGALLAYKSHHPVNTASSSDNEKLALKKSYQS